MKKLNAFIVLGLLSTSLSAHCEEGPITEYAKKSGYKSCLSTVSDIEEFFGENTSYGFWAFVASEKSDEQLFNATLELTYEHGSNIVDITIFPAKDGTCSFSYTQTFYSDKNCIATTKESYMANAKYKTEINKNVIAFENTGDSKIVLTPAGSGCLVQKKEIGFRHKFQNK